MLYRSRNRRCNPSTSTPPFCSPHPRHLPPAPSLQVNTLAFSRNGRLLYQGCGHTGELEVLRFPEMTRFAAYKGHCGSVQTIAVDPQDKWV
jgi:hypothetical protein